MPLTSLADVTRKVRPINFKVRVIDTTAPANYRDDRLDGRLTKELLTLLGVDAQLWIAQTKDDFLRALKLTTFRDFDILHIACQEHASSLISADGIDLDWNEIAAEICSFGFAPKALVMSSGLGETSEVERAFAHKNPRPNMIIGSTDKKYSHDYPTAWAILYRLFASEGITGEAAQLALERITAAVYPPFRCLCWDSQGNRYRG
jgi:hypothetical protein